MALRVSQQEVIPFICPECELVACGQVLNDVKIQSLLRVPFEGAEVSVQQLGCFGGRSEELQYHSPFCLGTERTLQRAKW